MPLSQLSPNSIDSDMSRVFIDTFELTRFDLHAKFAEFWSMSRGSNWDSKRPVRGQHLRKIGVDIARAWVLVPCPPSLLRQLKLSRLALWSGSVRF